MKNLWLKYFSKLSTTLAALVVISQVALAEENKIDLRLDADANAQYESNIAQIKDFEGDFSHFYSASFTGRYLAPSQTQVLVRVQGQFNKYVKRAEFDRMVFVGSLNLSQWLFNTLNVYVGAQPIQLISLSSTKRPLDMMYLGGAVYYLPFMEKELAYMGYQFDRLETESKDFKSNNHTVFIGYRHPFNDNFITYLGTRLRVRGLDIGQTDQQYNGNLSVQYLLNDNLTLQASGDYNFINSTVPERTTSFYNFGINLIGGFNKSLVFN